MTPISPGYHPCDAQCDRAADPKFHRSELFSSPAGRARSARLQTVTIGSSGQTVLAEPCCAPTMTSSNLAVRLAR